MWRASGAKYELRKAAEKSAFSPTLSQFRIPLACVYVTVPNEYNFW